MIVYGRWIAITVLLVFMSSAASGRGASLTRAQANPFIGTWVIEMTEPPEFTGTQTVRIWDTNGTVAASVQMGTSPAMEVTGIMKDANMLVLTINRDSPQAVRENGVAIWVVYTLTLDGGTMKVALTLEPSRTIKKGTGKKKTD